VTTAIKIEGLGKSYVIRHEQVQGYVALRDVLTDGAKRLANRVLHPLAKNRPWSSEEVFWALRDINLEIEEGERVGIIGRNGAGKSTLLKILSRITNPTRGRIRTHGRVASLLEVGTGFHPELSGRENIFLNGAILGMSTAEIRRKFDEIVAFSEIERFLDTPVKRYSSGMYLRLAFAVAVQLEPDILVVDEILAVGDAEFQRRCLGKMDELGRSGRTLLFVSHNMGAVSSLCTRGVLLSKGECVAEGPVDLVLKEYLAQTAKDVALEWSGDEGDDHARLRRTWIRSRGAAGELHTAVDIEIGVTIQIVSPIEGLILGFVLYSHHGYELARVLYDDRDSSPPPTIPPGVITKRFVIPKNTLAQGTYRVQFDVGIHMTKRIVRDEGALMFTLPNVAGLGRRFSVGEHRGGGGLIKADWLAE
jgi:lipopolysaccharide transport system ATP-binding protein